MSGHGTKHNEWPNLESDPGKGANSGGAGEPTGTGEPTGAGTTDRDDLMRQFQELGQRLAETARAAWQSEQRQDLQQDIKDGLRTVRDQLNDAVEGARSSARTQGMADTVKEQVNKASETVRSGDFLDELRGGLATGLRELNEQLRRFTDRLEQRDGDTSDAAATTETPGASPATAAIAASSTPEVDHVVPDSAPDTAALPEAPPVAKNELPTQPEGPTTGECH